MALPRFPFSLLSRSLVGENHLSLPDLLSRLDLSLLKDLAHSEHDTPKARGIDIVGLEGIRGGFQPDFCFDELLIIERVDLVRDLFNRHIVQFLLELGELLPSHGLLLLLPLTFLLGSSPLCIVQLNLLVVVQLLGRIKLAVPHPVGTSRLRIDPASCPLPDRSKWPMIDRLGHIAIEVDFYERQDGLRVIDHALLGGWRPCVDMDPDFVVSN